MIAKSHTFFGMVALLLVFSFAGCGKPAPQPVGNRVSYLDIQIEAGPRINPTPSGDPLSVVVRVYQLKELEELKKLTFEKACLEKSGVEFFGQDFVKESTPSEFSVVPGSVKTHIEALQPSTQYLAVVALFRQPDANFWRVVVQAKDLRPKAAPESKGFWGKGDAKASASPDKAGTIRLKVNDNYIAVEGATRVVLPGQPEGGKPLNR